MGMSFIGRLFSGQKDMDFSLGSWMAKAVTFSLFVEQINANRSVPLPLETFVSWSNCWLAPEFKVEMTGGKVVIYDGPRGTVYYKQSPKRFNRNLYTGGTRFAVVNNGFTDKEREVCQQLGQRLTDLLTAHLNSAIKCYEMPGTFDANAVLASLWQEMVGDLNSTVQSSWVDRL